MFGMCLIALVAKLAYDGIAKAYAEIVVKTNNPYKVYRDLMKNGGN